MERPSSEKVALLERVLNRIRENARDAASRARFLRAAPEPRKGAVAPHPAPTVSLAADQLPDATPLAGATPPPPAAAARAASPSPPAVAPSAPPAAFAPAPGGAAASPAPPPVAPAPSAPPPSLEVAAAAEPVEPLPPSGADYAPAAALPAAPPFGQEPGAHRPRATQSFGQQDDVHVDVAFDEERGARTSPPPPPAAADATNDVTGVRPIVPAAASGPRPPAFDVPAFGAPPPHEVDLASTIELPASELASAVHSTSRADEERPAPASSPRLRSSPGVVDDDTYPAVSPSSLPPERPYEAEARQAPPEQRSPADSQVGMRSPSAAPPPHEASQPPASDLAPPPLRRSEMPRPPAPSAHPEAEPAGLHLAVSPPPPAVAAPEQRPAPPPLGAMTLEADAFSRATVQGSPANFVAAVRGPAPRTFGELLDASLALGNEP